MSEQAKRALAQPTNQQVTAHQQSRVPTVDIRETPREIIILADMPGVDQSGLEVTVNQDLLTIRGTVQSDSHGGFTPLYQEYQEADFERSFTLPAELDTDKVVAAIKHGVLRVTLPKAQAVQPRRIPVQMG